MATLTHSFQPLYFYIILLVPYPTNALSFNIPRFDQQGNDIIYEGDARPNVGTIDFTSAIYFCHVGRATYGKKLRLWDSNTKQMTDFTTNFTFAIDTQNRSVYAAGLAFFLAPVGFQIPVNSIGGFLGLFNSTNSDSSQNQIVLVEFDSFSNSDWDPPYEHIGINENSIASAVTTPWNASFHSGDLADVWISYNAIAKNLSVSWKYRTTQNASENTSIWYQIDLMTVLPEWVVVGFSAATSNAMERHQIFSWSFSSSLEEQDSNPRRTNLILGLAIPLGVILIGGIILYGVILRRKLLRQAGVVEQASLTSLNAELERGAGPRRFSYKDLASATCNFSNERKLGEGGFGAVYKGYLIDWDIPIAVKKISRGSRQGKKEFITEVKVISSLRHRNLVQLIGWCHDDSEFLLVYEFMPNGSLDSHLFGIRNPLSWSVRYNITLGLASALLYLHEEWEQCVVHRDIKSSNVMLDSNFHVKLGDFGLARLIDHDVGPQTTGLAGTFGYMAPEYLSTRRASKESDVYSFGVVTLEIVTGKRSVDPMCDESEISLVKWVWDLYGKGKGKLMSGADERLGKGFDAKQVECLMTVGLWCAHPDRGLRPSIRHALQVLKFEASAPSLPSKMPVAVYHVPAAPPVSSGDPFITTSIQDGR